MTIHELLAAAGLTANDEIPIWDAEATGEPTKKITAQQLAAAVVALANLVTSVNNQTGAVSITPSNIGAVAKTGDTMTGRLEMSLDANSTQDRITFSCPNVVGPMQLVANATGTQQRVTFRQYTPDGMSFEEYALPNTADYADGPALRNILTDKSPVTIPQGGTGATTPDGARANLGALGLFATYVSFGGSATNFYQNLGAQISTMADSESRIFAVTADETSEPFYQWHTYSGTITRYANATCGGILTDQTEQAIIIGCNGGTWFARSL